VAEAVRLVSRGEVRRTLVDTASRFVLVGLVHVGSHIGGRFDHLGRDGDNEEYHAGLRIAVGSGLGVSILSLQLGYISVRREVSCRTQILCLPCLPVVS
jgi:hypothetical protein